MAKQYRIKFAEGLTKIQKSETDASLLSVREVEIMALDALFSAAASKQQDVKKLNLCYDCLEQVQNLKDENAILFTRGDLDFLEEGLKATVDRRPPAWFWARNIFRQLEKPEEIEA